MRIRELISGFFKFLLPFFFILFSFSSCTPFAALSLIESLIEDEQLKEPSHHLFLATPKIATSRDVEVMASGCMGFTHVAVSESASAPTEDSVMWQPCLNASTVYTYQLSTPTVGEKTLYFHTMNGNKVNSISKSVKVTYAPKAILGQNSFNEFANYLNGLHTPIGFFTTGTDFWLADYGNNRILKYNSLPASNSVVPDFVLGQPNLHRIKQNYGGVSGHSLYGPHAILIDSNKLFVADSTNNRVLIWNSIPSHYLQNADVVLGQPDLNSAYVNYNGLSASSLRAPRGLAITDGKLIVADYSNHRVLIWNTIPTSNTQPADVVLGQSTMTTSTASYTTMYNPVSVVVSGTKLFVADSNNNRVLIWNTIPTVNGQPADIVLGQPNLNSNSVNAGGNPANNTLYDPYSIAVSGTKLIVSDLNNHRVLIWNAIPTVNQQPADVVLGQPDFTTRVADNPQQGPQTMNTPRALAVYGNKLVLADSVNHRVMIWNSIPTTNYEPADVVFGQPSFTSGEYQNIGKKISSSTIIAGRFYTDGTRLVGTDVYTNRVLIWNSIPTTNNRGADVVLGQNDFNSSLANQGFSTMSSTTLKLPIKAIIAANKLILSDNGNSRVLIWNSLPTTNNQPADVVIGQANFNSAVTGVARPDRMDDPERIFSDGTRLIVPEADNNRVLIWNTIPTTNGVSASVVLGQEDFYSNTSNFGGINTSSMKTPTIGEFYNNKLYIGESNSRMLVWNTIPTANNQISDYVLGQPDAASAGTPIGDEMKKFGVPRSLFFKDNSMFLIGSRLGIMQIWKTIPTNFNSPADMVYGYNFVDYQPDVAPPFDEYSIQDSTVDIYTDGYRLFLGDLNRYMITPFPNVLLAQPSLSKRSVVKFTVRSCDGIKSVLFNEGSVPDRDASHWQSCSTETGDLSYTLPNQTQGRRNIKVWYKDLDGHVLPVEQGIIPYIYDSIPTENISAALASSAVTNSSSGTLNIYGGCSQILDVFAGSSPNQPTDSDLFSVCGTSTGAITYNLNEPLADGVHSIYVWSRDEAGNISTSATVVNVTIDRTPPVSVPALSIAGKYLASNSRLSFTASHCTDVASILINESDSLPNASDTNWQTCSTSANGLAYKLTKATNSVHNLRIWAKDSVGNINQTPAYLSYSPAGVPTIIGQINADSIYSAQTGQSTPVGIDTDGTRLVVADARNNRVLIWNNLPLSINQLPDLVLGQQDFVTVTGNTFQSDVTASSLSLPNAVKIFNNKLIVTDSLNHRVLIWNSFPTVNGQPADLVLGQPNFNSKTSNNGGRSASSLSTPSGVDALGSKLIVSDKDNHRVLIWNSFPTVNGQPADLVLGQPTMKYGSSNFTGRGAQTLSTPMGISILNSTHLAVVDQGNHRVLIWNTIPDTNFTAADVVVGQSSFTGGSANSPTRSASSLNSPRNVYFGGSKFFVTDSGNHRVLIWNSIPSINGQAADVVIGQTNFTGFSAGTTSTRYNSPRGVIVDSLGRLLITDSENSRVGVYNTIPTSNGSGTSLVLGQNSISGSLVNGATSSLINGLILQVPTSFFANNNYSLISDITNNRILLWNNSAASGSPQVVLGQTTSNTTTATTTASGLSGARSGVIIGTKLIVSDYGNNRILIWNTIPTSNGQPADVVLGQSVFTSSTSNSGGISSSTLYEPYDLTTDGIRLIVADRGNNRVLIWNTVPTNNKTPADLVLGQLDFQSSAPDAGGVSASTMDAPISVSTDGLRLAVSDYNNNRILIWNTFPVSNGQPADVVVGQLNLTSATTGKSLNRLNNPHGVLIANNKLYISDRSNYRVLIFDSIPTTNNVSADHMLGQYNVSNTFEPNLDGISSWSIYEPGGLSYYDNKLYISDIYNHRIIGVDVGL